MEFEEGVQRVYTRWKEVFGLYERMRSVSEPAVVRWEWSLGERYSVLPYHFNRFPGRSRALKNGPAAPGFYYRYGLDVQDRPRLLRYHKFQRPPGRERARDFEGEHLGESFFLYSDDLIEIIEFSVPPRIPIDVQRIDLEDGRVVRHSRLRLNGYTPLYSEKGKDPDALLEWLGPNGRLVVAERYVYEGGRLTRIRVAADTPGIGAHEYEERFSYDQAGKLQRIDRLRPGNPDQLVYLRRGKGETFQSIQETASRMLVEAIAARLQAERIGEPVCFIELSYRAGDVHFPPLVVIGLERARRRLLDSGDPDAPSFVFNTAMIGPMRFVQIEDPEVVEACERLEQEVRAGERWDAATRTLRDVAAELTRRDWTGVMDVTGDFVVFAIDWEMEGDDLEKILAASVSGEQMREWRKKGWLGD